MKNYIFLTPTIRNVGGAQLYIARKQEWLESLGWMVSVFYYSPGPVVIEALRKYENNYIPELSDNIYSFTSKQIDSFLDRILSVGYDKIIIESHLPGLCLWGERVALRANGMNICYPLCEGFPKLKKYQREYFESRLNKNLLFGIVEESIPMLLGESPMTRNRALAAIGCTTNNVDDIFYDLSLLNGQHTILSLGRLDKPYVPSVVDEIGEFADNHSDVQFNVILLGCSAEKELTDSLIANLSLHRNINVICTGYLFPIPRCILQKSDVAIASSGSVYVASQEGIPTVAIDANDYKAIGVWGYTTQNTLYREFEPQQNISKLLEEILIEKKYKKTTVVKSEKQVLDYSEHKKIIDSYQTNLSYIKICRRPLIEYPIFVLYQICGRKGLEKLKKIVKRFLLKK